jgi:hypothetical protein
VGGEGTCSGQFVIDRQGSAADLDSDGCGPGQKGHQRACLVDSGVLLAALRRDVTGGGPPVLSVGESVPVLLVDDAGSAADGPAVCREEGLAIGVRNGRMQEDLGLRGSDLHQLTRADLAGHTE